MTIPEAQNLRDQVDRKTLELLVCPLTKTRLALSPNGDELISVVARLAFPIRKGVPLLALDEARPFDPEQMTNLSDLSGN